MWMNLKARIFDWLSLDAQRCYAYGGLTHIWDDGTTVGIRLCGKNRWHIDSHAYETEQHRLYRRDGLPNG